MSSKAGPTKGKTRRKKLTLSTETLKDLATARGDKVKGGANKTYEDNCK